MLSSKLLGITTITYLICMVTYFTYLFFRNPKFGKIITGITIFALTVHTVALGLRWYESYQLGYGHIPLSNLYESLMSLAWTTVLLYLIIEFRYKSKALGIFIFPIVSIAMAYASLSPNIQDEIEPLIPALQSNWLTYHVITCFLSYSAFAISFGSSITYLMKLRKSSKNNPGQKEADEMLPSMESLDDIIYKTVAIGFLLLSIGIITGAVWANYAWGSYWSWDPKETWSLITWFVYAAFIHARLTRGWRGRRTAILSIFGFAAVLFTFLGVNFLLSGLHSYGSGA
jgi:cytochrome c-type biogenesis protein CcsB